MATVGTYDELPDSVRRMIEQLFPAPAEPPKADLGAKGSKKLYDPQKNPIESHFTPEEIEELGIDPKGTLEDAFKKPGARELPPRDFPLPIPEPATGQRMSLGGPQMAGTQMDLFSMLGLGGEDPAAQGQAPVQPAMQGGPAPTQGGGPWSSALADPATRAFLLSTGLQMMTGGWGNGVQQAGAALGKGAEAASGVNDAAREEAMMNKKLAQSETNARIGADSRAEVANIRTAAMLDRTKMNLSAKAQPSEALKYRAEARKIYEGNLRNMQKTQEEREAEIEDLAGRMFDADRARGRGATGANSTGTGGTEGGATTTPGTGAPKATSTAPGLSQLARDPKLGAKVQEDLRSPEGQARILRTRPDLKGEIDAWNNANSAAADALRNRGQ